MKAILILSVVLLVTGCGRESGPARTSEPAGASIEPMPSAAQRCAVLSELELVDLEFARPIAALTSQLVPATETVREYCHVEGIVWPATKFHVKLPSDWNARFVMTGNGGPGGPIDPSTLDRLVGQGYAVAGDSAGHLGDRPLWSYAFNPSDNSNPNAQQMLIDHGYRSIHETTAIAKQLMPRFYDQQPDYAYYMGGSTGGRQGLMNAQRYPEDFDGWAISRPVLDVSHTAMQNVWNARAVTTGPSKMPLAKLPAFARSVLASCDALDDLVDGLVDPARCHFDPLADLELCPADTDSDTCFTRAQATGIERVFTGPKTSDGVAMFVPTAVSSEQFAPSRFAGGQMASIWIGELLPRDPSDVATSLSLAYGSSFLQAIVYKSESWDWQTASLDDFEEVVRPVSAITDATDPELTDVLQAGKKILMHHGWSDALVTPYQAIRYYERVRETLGDQQTESFFKFYMIPGMGHVSSIGPNQVDWLGTLRAWVEEGTAPEALVASRPANPDHGISPLTRLLCPYPQIAVYVGDGSQPAEAADFDCRNQ